MDAVEEAAVRSVIGEVNTTAPMLRATQARVPLSEIFGLHAFGSAGWLAKSVAPPQSHERAGHDNGGNGSGGGGAGGIGKSGSSRATRVTDPLHAATVACISLEATRPLVLPKLQAWLQALTMAHHVDLYRMKGVLAISGRDERFVLHGIHAQVQGHFERPWGAREARSSALVVIAHRLDRRALAEGFRACEEGADGGSELDRSSRARPGDRELDPGLPALRCGDVAEEAEMSPQSSHPKSE